MDRWLGKVAAVTGASSGIGAAIVQDLVKHGLIVVGLARRIEKMEKIRGDLDKTKQKNFHPIKCDVSEESDVINAFNWIEKNLGGVDILVNNAGILYPGQLITPDFTENIKRTVNVNIMGIVYCTREAFKSMKKRNVDGHVVLINSVLGHKIARFLDRPSNSNIYGPTKFAVTAMTEVYRMEFADEKTKTKITSISPGLVETEILPPGTKEAGFSILQAEDISNAVIYVLGTPPHVQIHEMTVKPVGELF